MNHTLSLSSLTALLVPLVPLVLFAGATAPAQTNTLLIIADDVGIDAVGCYGLGSSPPPTPNIDALAARGVRFSNAQTCPVCSPTRACVMTGRHAFRTGVGRPLTTGSPGLDPGEVLLPEVLAPAGIATALIGKWHLGDDLGPLTPTAEGFGLFTGTIAGAINDYSHWPKVENGVVAFETNYATTDEVDEALAFITTATEPWCVVLSFHSAHTPMHAPPAGLHTQNLLGLDPAITPVPFFKAMIEAMDTEIGRLLATIPTQTLDATNVVFLGDNGTEDIVTEAPFDPTHGKTTVYDGGVHVPLIIAGPAVAGSPRVETHLAHSVDLFTTLAELQGVDAGAALPAGVALDGVSLVPLLQAAGQPAVRRYAYAEKFSGSAAMTQNGDQEVMRSETYSLLRFVEAGVVREEMYDLVADPYQTTDLMLQSGGPPANAYRNLGRAIAELRGVAWTAPFGYGCSGGGIQPVLRTNDLPELGTTFTMRVTGVGVGVPAVIGTLGLSNDTWNGNPLPYDLSAAGMLGCMLWSAPLTTRFVFPVGSVAQWSESIPVSPLFVGLTLFAQGFVLAPAANPGGALTTRGLEILIGE
ncbi:MAG: sulfatase-like hydrolase/transferase [Planctomycetes bacterium]|nr:sulfatase-like hydrolase/transferase [Planctomycetota bacterium]